MCTRKHRLLPDLCFSIFHLIFRSMESLRFQSRNHRCQEFETLYNSTNLQSLKGSKKVRHFEYRVYNPHRQTVDWNHYPQGNSWGARVVVFKIFSFVSNFSMMKTDTFCFVFSACKVILFQLSTEVGHGIQSVKGP